MISNKKNLKNDNYSYGFILILNIFGYYKERFSMSSGNYELDQLRDIIFALEQTMTRTNQKNTMQIEIFTDYVKIFQKHAQKLTALSNKIN